MAELITQRAYAKLRGVSPPAVCKAVKTGRIRLVYGKIDPEQADREWAANTLGMGDKGPTGGNGGRPAGQVAGEAASPGGTYSDQRAIHEGFKARLAQLDFERQSGKVLEGDKVRAAWFNNTRRARDMLLTIPDRLAPVLAGESDRFEVHRILLEEIRRVCDDIANVSVD
jgi:hypothetical protein